MSDETDLNQSDLFGGPDTNGVPEPKGGKKPKKKAEPAAADTEFDPWTDDAVGAPPPEVVAAGEDLDSEYTFGPPPRDHGFRVCGRPEWRTPGVMLVTAPDGEKVFYFVTKPIGPAVLERFPGHAKMVVLVWWQNAQGRQGIWWMPPGETPNTWLRSAQVAAGHAINSWVRVAPDNGKGKYRCIRLTNQPPAPEWPELSRLEVLKAAFGKRVITSLDEPVLENLGGEELV